jgi:hypothetical protein
VHLDTYAVLLTQCNSPLHNLLMEWHLIKERQKLCCSLELVHGLRVAKHLNTGDDRNHCPCRSPSFDTRENSKGECIVEVID